VAVVSMMRFAGDPDDLFAKVRDSVDPVTARLSPEHGRIANVVARTGDGILVINIWRDEAGRQAMSEEPEVQEAVRSAGLPPPQLDAFEVLALRLDEATDAA
jgi:hypothetical protein